jgi:peptidoglycan/xylan/chitin deacetylase (PgdA/CDA1 family)
LPPERIVRQVERFLRLRFRPAPLADAVEGRGRLLHVTFDDAFRSAERVLPELEARGVPLTIFVCPRFADVGAPLTVPELVNEPREELLTMAWERIQELAASGVGVESHTSSHRHLPELGDDELDRELRDSKAALEDRLRRRGRFLAYPFGDHDERVRRAAERAGYEAAFAVEGDRSERFALPRVAIYRGEGAPRIALKTVRRGR